MISIIVAVSENNVIGKNNGLPWDLPEDLKYFKQITNGSTVVMGRKCYESIPEKHRPLSGRDNVVITRQRDYDAPNCEVRRHLKDTLREYNSKAYQSYGNFFTNNTNREIFVIGGSQIYKEAFELADRLYLTRVHKEVEGDVFLEGFNPSEWILKSAELGKECTFCIYEKNYV